MKWALRATLCLAAMAFAGCGDKASNDTAADDKPTMSNGMPDESRPVVTLESLGGAGRVQGIVRFEGALPESREIRVAGDKFCVGELGELFTDPDMIVDADGGVQNVFVYLQGGVPEYQFAIPDEIVGIDQSGCQYVPRVLGVRVGQTLQFRNGDATLHNVHSVVDKRIGNKAFNFGIPGRKGVAIEKTFASSEIMVRIKCDVHPWMVAWVGVLPHPWFAVTDATGAFRMEQVPDGEYMVAAWHERLGQATGRVRIEAGVSSPLEIHLPGAD